jgi:hypothetical protein
MFPKEPIHSNQADRLEQLVGFQAAEALYGTREVVTACMCKRCSAVHVRSQMNQLRRLTFLHRTIRFNIIFPFTNDPRTGFLYSDFPLNFPIHISPSPGVQNLFSLKT